MIHLKDDYSIGLDLGTTNSCIGVYRNGGVEIIPNRLGERTTPSIVTILDNEIKVGEDAIDSLVKDYDRSIYEIKRFIGRKFKDKEVEEDIKKLPFEIVSSDDGIFPNVKIIRNKKSIKYSPEEISSFIIKKMIKNAEKYLKKSIKRAVITVPAYFNDAQRNLTKQAAELVDIKVERVLNEPVAAALAYGLEKTQGNLNILVFDLGGGTFDVSILNLKEEENERSFNVLSKEGDSHLGGEDFDNVLVDYFIEEFCRQFNIKEQEIRKDQKLLKKLKINCEFIKRGLSKEEETVLCIDNFFKDYSLLQRITRSEFESRSKPLFERLMTPLNKVLANAKLKEIDIKEILLIGGSTRIPKIKEILKNKFLNSKINDTINPDEAVAYGATLYADKISHNSNFTDYDKKLSLFDICPFALGTDIVNNSIIKEEQDLGKLMSVIIKKGTHIPCNHTETYSTASDYQEEILVEVYEGENKYVKYNHFLGKILLTDITKELKGKVSVNVNFSIDINGILTVTAEEVNNKKNKQIKVINEKVCLSSEEIAKIKQKNRNDYRLQSKTSSSKTIDGILLNNNLNIYENSFLEGENDEEKICAITNYNETLEKFIDKFDKTSFDNEILLEKYYLYIKQLFTSYSKTLNLKLEESKRELIVSKIKTYIDIFKKRSFGYLTGLLEVLKDINKENFYNIVIYCMELMNNCGNDCLKSMKEFCKYHSTVYFDHSLYLSRVYINERKLGTLRTPGILQKFQDVQGECKRLLEGLNNNSIVLMLELKKSGKLIGGGTGFTYSYQKLGLKGEGEQEDMKIVLATYERMLSEIQSQQNRDSTEEEAFCIANIIKINYQILTNTQYERYLRLCDDCDLIVENLNDFDESKEWYQEYIKMKDEITEKYDTKNEVSTFVVDECKKNYPDIFDEIENYSQNKNKQAFIDFILKNHPYKGYEDDKKNNKKNFNVYNKDLVDFLIKKYHPDNYDLTNDEEGKLYYARIHYVCSKLNVMLTEF